MKKLTEEELTHKAEAYCSAAERCPSEIEAKLAQWGNDNEQTARHIIEHLFKERYLDNIRFCRAFVRDKYRFNQWGRTKIIQALRMKQLPAEAIETGLAEIDEQEYHSMLRNLLSQKSRSIKARTAYEHNAKLIRFAAGRGFSMDEILHHIRQTETDEYPC